VLGLVDGQLGILQGQGAQADDPVRPLSLLLGNVIVEKAGQREAGSAGR
jgi:hypothetical protein